MRPDIIGAALLSVTLAQPVLADPEAQGRAMAEAFLSGEMQLLWDNSTPEMQASLGTVERFRAVRAELAEAFGEEAELLDEVVIARGPHHIYQRAARWSEGSGPIQTIVTLDAEGRVAGFFVRPQPEAAPSDRLDHVTQAELRLPFDGAWSVIWGGREIAQNYHAVDRAQRFATDFVVIENGSTHVGDGTELAQYHCWDRPILAPAAGTVVRAMDGLPDQPIGQSDPRRPAGNHVVIDFGAGEFGFLAHFREGSLAVAEGETVVAGQEIGRCGNSGNTSEPHLHFHLQTTPVLHEGEGLPAQFTDYLADGTPVERGEPLRGQLVRPAE